MVSVCVRPRCMILPVLVAILASCGDPAGPVSSPPVPSILTGCFSGDSTLIEKHSTAIYLQGQKNSCQATLSWTSCHDGDFLRYDLYRCDSPGFAGSTSEAEVVASFQNATDTIFTDTDTGWGSTFYYALLTVDADKDTAWSNEVGLTMPGDIPDRSLLTGWIDCSTATLRWTHCEAYDFESYRLYRAESPGIAGDTASAVFLRSFTGRFDTVFTDSLLLPTEEGYWYSVLTGTTKGFHSWSNEFNVFVEEPRPYPWRVIYEAPLETYSTGMATSSSGDRAFCTHMGYSVEEVSMETFYSRVIEGSPSSRHICVNPEVDLAYLSPYEGDILVEIGNDPGGGQRICQLSGSPGECCTAPDGLTVYAPFLDDQVIWVIDASSFSVVDILYTDSRVRQLACHPSGEELYALSYIDNTLTILTTDPPGVVFEIPIGDLPVDMDFTPDGEELYVSCLGSDAIWRISCRERRVLEVIEISNPTDIVIHPSGDYMYVIQTQRTIGIYAIPGHKLVQTIDPGAVVTDLEALPSGLHMLYSKTTPFSSNLVILGV